MSDGYIGMINCPACMSSHPANYRCDLTQDQRIRDLEREVERLKAEWQGVEPKARRIATLWRNDALEAAADIADRYGEPLIRDDILALLTPIDAAMAKDPQL